MADRVFIAVLQLSVSGFVFCAVFLPLQKPVYRVTSAKTMVSVNTAALFSFVFPLYLAVSYHDGSGKLFRDYAPIVFRDAGLFENIVVAVREMHAAEYFCGIWLLGAACLFICRMGEYLCFMEKAVSGGFDISGSVWAEAFGRLEREAGVRNVRLIGSCRISSPCAFGVRHRYIAIPAAMMNAFAENEAELILRHEFYHVIHRDLLRKFLIMQIGCIHWFNPLFYLLKENLSDWQEAACDDEVTKGFGAEEKRKYVRLVMKVLELQKDTGGGGKWGAGMLGSDMKNCRKRFERLLREQGGNGKRGRALAASITLFSLFLGNAAAKEADVAVNLLFSKNVHVADREELVVREVRNIEAGQLQYSGNAGGLAEFRPYGAADAAYDVLCGGAFAAFPAGNGPPGTGHICRFEDIMLREHCKYPDGSCKSVFYESEECPVCGTIRKGAELWTDLEAECPHESEKRMKGIYRQVADNGPDAAGNGGGAMVHHEQ